MILYQCQASGISDIDSPFDCTSRRVFATSEQAEAYMPQFVANCKAKTKIVNLETLQRTSILELELLDQ